MHWLVFTGAALAVFVAGYLIVALLWPERLS